MSEQATPAFVMVSHTYQRFDGQNNNIANVSVHLRGDSWWVSDMWVHPEHRRKGLASLLLETAVALNGHRRLWIQVAPYTDGAVSFDKLEAFYGRFGFKVTDVPTVMVREPTHEGATEPRAWVGEPSMVASLREARAEVDVLRAEVAALRAHPVVPLTLRSGSPTVRDIQRHVATFGERSWALFDRGDGGMWKLCSLATAEGGAVEVSGVTMRSPHHHFFGAIWLNANGQPCPCGGWGGGG